MSDPRIEINQRRNPRVKVQMPAVLGESAGRVICTLLDISAAGALARCNRAIEEMSLVELQFSLRVPRSTDEIEVRSKAAVVRCEQAALGHFDVGLYFTDMSDEVRARLGAFIAAMQDAG